MNPSKSFHVGFRDGCGRDRSGRSVLAIQGLAVPVFPLLILGRLDAGECGFRRARFSGESAARDWRVGSESRFGSISISPHILGQGTPSRAG